MTETKQDNAYTATIGFFDGVHVGHQYLLQQLRTCAAACQQKSLVISFDQHPRKVLRTDFQPLLLTENAEKELLLKKQNIDDIVFLHFTQEMSQLTAAEFMQEVLCKQLNVKTLLLGYDHRFGSDKLSSFSDYQTIAQSMGVELILQEQFAPAGQKVSSSHIRKLIQQSEIETANNLLGYSYFLNGTIVKGFQLGSKMGFPTANIQIANPDKLIPPTGVYAVSVCLGNETHMGMLNIGLRPTIHTHAQRTIEVHILDFDKKIYGENVTIYFLKKLREEQKFESIDQLKSQLKSDREQVKNLFGE